MVPTPPIAAHISRISCPFNITANKSDLNDKMRKDREELKENREEMLGKKI
jgi:hypothetical protein